MSTGNRASRTTRPADAERRTPTLVDSVALIAGREITMRVRSKAFLISTGVLMLAVLASVVLGSTFGAQPETTKVAVVAEASSVVDGNDALEAVPAADDAEAEQLLRDGEVEAIVAPSASDPLGITVVAYSDNVLTARAFAEPGERRSTLGFRCARSASRDGRVDAPPPRRVP